MLAVTVHKTTISSKFQIVIIAYETGMTTVRPQALKNPTLITDFPAHAKDFLSQELPIIGIECSEEQIDNKDFSNIEIRNSIFEHWSARDCIFEKACFIDVIFRSCDLSNSKFSGAYFERCIFVSCKCIGIDMSETIVKKTTFEQSNLQYSFFNKTKMTDVVFKHIDFTESSMSESKLKRFSAAKSMFIKSNFFRTMLATVDFSDNEFIAPTMSNPPVELKGAIINVFQAADLIGLWGVTVNRD
jgi:uncharacterized protein YjbI with pentapeptide repeats